MSWRWAIANLRYSEYVKEPVPDAVRAAMDALEGRSLSSAT